MVPWPSPLTNDETLVQAPKHVPQHDEFPKLLVNRKLGQDPAQEGQLTVVGALCVPVPADRERAHLADNRYYQLELYHERLALCCACPAW